MNPLVSIIMPCFNGEGTISIAIDSVLMQSFSDFELIIVDDASRDNSVKIIEEYERRDKRIVKIKNLYGSHGVSHARNLAIERAKGRFICFLDCDDYLSKDSLKFRVELLSSTDETLVFGPYFRLERGEVFVPVVTKDYVTFNDMLRRNMIGNLTGMYDSQRVGKIYQKDIRHEDYLMWCEILQSCNRARSTGGNFLGVYRVSSSSLSGNKIKSALWHWNVLRKGLKIGFFYSVILQLHYIFGSVSDRLTHLAKATFKK
jgi:teichuronic acid biosynthesis glycosyltransferase TuaG